MRVVKTVRGTRPGKRQIAVTRSRLGTRPRPHPGHTSRKTGAKHGTNSTDPSRDKWTPKIEAETQPALEVTLQTTPGNDVCSANRDSDVLEGLHDLPHETASAISLYMREAGQVPLLTPEEEIELAARIKKGDEAAREQMIRANLRLVVKIAREYEGLGLPLLDLINEGNIGLMKAVERFDPAKGGKLSTYSSWWIKQSIRRALANQGKTIRLPVHVADKIYHLRLAELRLQETLGREPTEEELAQELKTTPKKVAALRSAAVRPASLDAPLGDEDSSRLGEVVPDDSSPNPAEVLERRTTAAKVMELINRLPEREASILRFRFGLHGGPEKTLEEVGRKFGVTRERVRQLQNLALNKLRRMLEEDLHGLGVST
ncbi:MAG: RNA polymerase sigma factor RpoD/SigA [Verrucomicrobiota bacterium]|nr:RNA polymerase sigma factor RpoD/SigA [Limisphaera sp.]MDW8381807.1 RNA polymerase sigma factor RpoD/SigA [Verrucomicrobiota bacterium]